MMGVHETEKSANCAVCHGYTNMMGNHQDQCGWCHDANNAPVYPGKNECAECHQAGVVGSQDTSPVLEAHYGGREAQHTASDQSGNVAGFACSTCHDMNLKVEHLDVTFENSSTPSSSFPTTTTPEGKCAVCHNTKVDTLPIRPWQKTCDTCHKSNHREKDAKHDYTDVGGFCSGTGTKQTIMSESFDSVTAPAWPSEYYRGGYGAGWSTTTDVVQAAPNSAPNSAVFVADANGNDRVGLLRAHASTFRATRTRRYRSGSTWRALATTGCAPRSRPTAAGSWTDVLEETNGSIGWMQVGPVPVPAARERSSPLQCVLQPRQRLRLRR